MLKVEPEIRVLSFHSGWENASWQNFVFTGESHDFWEFMWVVSGKVGVAKNEKIFELREGDIIFYRPMEFHSIWTMDDDPIRVTIMSFSLGGNSFSSLGDGIFKTERYEQRLISDALTLYKKSKEAVDRFALQLAAIRIEELLLRLVTLQTPEQTHHISTGARIYKRILSFLDSHLCDNLSTEEIAKECCLSVSNLKKIFKKYSGMGIIQYYNEQRMILATMLIRRDFKMSEIAERLGFSTQNYFTESFKRHMGMTPMQYKKQTEKNGE